MGPLSWLWTKRKREPTRAEVEKLVALGCPGGSDLDKLRWLLHWIFQSSPYSHAAMIERARRLGIRPDWVDQLISGDVAFGFRWDLIEVVLKDCSAPLAAVEVARELFHNFPRVGLPPAVAIKRPPPPNPAAAGSRDDAERASARTRSDKWTGQHCPVLLTDVVGFGAPERTDQDHRIIREVMYRIVRDALATALISRDSYHEDDRGDGILIVVSHRVATKQIVHPVVTHIGAELSQHNADAEDGTRFKLRAALDVGPVESDAEGVNGKVIIDVARLIELRAFKQRLAKAPQDLGFIASQHVYDSVIKQHPGQLERDKYQEITGRVKGRRLTGWVNLAPDNPRE